MKPKPPMHAWHNWIPTGVAKPQGIQYRCSICGRVTYKKS